MGHKQAQTFVKTHTRWQTRTHAHTHTLTDRHRHTTNKLTSSTSSTHSGGRATVVCCAASSSSLSKASLSFVPAACATFMGRLLRALRRRRKSLVRSRYAITRTPRKGSKGRERREGRKGRKKQLWFFCFSFFLSPKMETRLLCMSTCRNSDPKKESEFYSKRSEARRVQLSCDRAAVMRCARVF